MALETRTQPARFGPLQRIVHAIRTEAMRHEPIADRPSPALAPAVPEDRFQARMPFARPVRR